MSSTVLTDSRDAFVQIGGKESMRMTRTPADLGEQYRHPDLATLRLHG